MGNRRSKAEEALPPLQLERLMGETGFAKKHVTMLHFRFRDMLCFRFPLIKLSIQGRYGCYIWP